MLSGYILWHYGAGLRAAVRIARNFIAFAVHLFSMKELSRSLFAPWRRVTDTTNNLGLLSSQMVWVIWDNTLSRILGASARLILLTLGFVFLVLVSLAAGIALLAWIVGPLLPPMLIFLGFFLLI